MFEIKKTDLAGRIGILHTNHGVVETPAFVPVIHPYKQTIPTDTFKKMGFEMVITNAYITMKHYGDEAIKRGIHDIIGFDGSVMTDSGGYQVLEYGDVDVTPDAMAKFETGILSDIPIPLDRPTGFGLQYEKANDYVNHTLDVSKRTIQNRKDNGQMWMGPIQGGEHEELVIKSSKELVEYGYDILALGSPVEFMESYRYNLLAKMILSVKKNIPASIPLHLFGAGHPLTIPLAISLGCDTFDSASYVLYARYGRYITEDATKLISEIEYFGCSCQVCSNHTPREILDMSEEDRISSIALHNLYAIKLEVDRAKQAIHEGRLWEYVMKKARAHPKLFESIPVFTSNTEYLAKATPKFKSKAVFFFAREDQYRPEAHTFRRIVSKFKTEKNQAAFMGDTSIKPAYSSAEYTKLFTTLSNPDQIQFCQYNPFLGIIPIELSDFYPAAHNVTTSGPFNPLEFPTFAESWENFFEMNNFDVIHIPDDQFIKHFTKEFKDLEINIL